MLIHELLNKDPDIVPEEAPLVILDSKSAMCMANNGRDAKHTGEIVRRINFVRNGEKCNICKIHWCEGGLQLESIATKDVGEHDLTPRMKYIMVRLYNWDRTLLQERWQNTGLSMEQEFCMTRLDLVEYSTHSVWNFCIKVWYTKRTFKNVCSRKTMLFWMGKSVEVNPCIKR